MRCNRYTGIRVVRGSLKRLPRKRQRIVSVRFTERMYVYVGLYVRTSVCPYVCTYIHAVRDASMLQKPVTGARFFFVSI
jgi:hypothetical protein